MENQQDIAQLQRSNERLSRQVVMYSELLDHIIKHSREKATFDLIDVLSMMACIMKI